MQCSWFLCRHWRLSVCRATLPAELPRSCQPFEVAAARTSRLVNLVLSRQTGFYTRLLGQGSKLYPSNMFGVYSPFSYAKLTIVIWEECKFFKNSNKFVITVLIITTMTWKYPISRFFEDVSKRRRTFFLYEFAHVWQNNRLVIIAKKFERMWIDFLLKSDVLTAVAVVVPYTLSIDPWRKKKSGHCTRPFRSRCLKSLISSFCFCNSYMVW